MSVTLDHVAQQVARDVARGHNPDRDYTRAMCALYTKLSGSKVEIPDDMALAFHIRNSTYQSEILEALLLSKCPYEDIQEAFKIPVTTVEAYAELYFDTTQFRTELDKLEYIEDYDDPTAKELKAKAVDLGYEYVLFNFANFVPKTIAHKHLVEKMFMATAYKAMAMNYNSIRSEVNKQAVKHAELMIKAFELLQKANANDTGVDYDLKVLLASDKTEDKTLAVPSLKDIV